MSFDFERMTHAFELIDAEYRTPSPRPKRPLPSTARFLSAMSEVLALFETLGSAFTFVKRDIEKKLAIISHYAQRDPTHFSDLNDAVEFEIHTGALRVKQADGTPSCSRTLLRLLWALKFSDYLLEGLGKTFDHKSGLADVDRTLKWAVARAYDVALAEHHSWTLRKSVKSACLLLPTKESFMDRVGIDLDRREEFISRLAVSMSPLVDRMYKYYEERHLLELP